jgi:hypothetical protein
MQIVECKINLYFNYPEKNGESLAMKVETNENH